MKKERYKGIMKKICKHKAIAKGKGERYWRCVFCGQKVADPTQLKDKEDNPSIIKV